MILRIKQRLDSVLRASGVVGLFVIWMGVAALWIPPMRPPFLSLLHRSLISFTNFKGTTPWGFISSDLVQPVLLLIFFVVLLRKSHGEDAVKTHWQKDGIVGLKAIGLLVVFYYLPIFLWKGARIVYEDHQSSIARNRQLHADNKSLSDQLADAQSNAEHRCEQTKDAEINRLKKQSTAACFNPDRRLEPMEKEQLFSALKRIRIEMEKQKQAPYFLVNGFSGDAETSRFATALLPIFQNAGWIWKPILPSQNPADVLKAKAEQDEQEKWMRDHGFLDGITVFDKNWPKGFGTSVAIAFSQADLTIDWSQSNREQAKELPHLDVLTIWVGYKPVH
jgi:hypothetical protein